MENKHSPDGVQNVEEPKQIAVDQGVEAFGNKVAKIQSTRENAVTGSGHASDKVDAAQEVDPKTKEKKQPDKRPEFGSAKPVRHPVSATRPKSAVANDDSETVAIVKRTALRTLIILVAALVVIFSFYILVFPASAGSFCYTIGMKNTSAWLSSRAAKSSGKVEDYYRAFVRAVDAKNHSLVELAGVAMLDPQNVEEADFTSTEFNSFCDKMDDNETLSERDFSTKTYVQYNYIFSVTKRLSSHDAKIFELSKTYINSGSSYYYAAFNPLKAYIDAAVENKKIDAEAILEEFMAYYESYSWRDKVGGDHSTAQQYMRQDLKRLAEAKYGEKQDGKVVIVWEEGNSIHDYWKSKLK